MLVRHGLTPTTGKEMPTPSPGPALSEVGRQAQQAADYIASRVASLPPLGGLYTSPLLRTRQTAAPIAAAVGLKPTVERASLTVMLESGRGRH